MRYYLSNNHVLKWLEIPALFDIKKDELYEIDGEAFEFLNRCTSPEGCEVDNIDADFLSFCLSEGVLTTEGCSEKRALIVKSPVPSLRYLELQVTDKCNLKCRHCFVGASQNIELSVAAIKNILDEFIEMQGLRLMITGGEPLMHSAFEEINAILPDYKCRKVLFTNGLLLNRQILKKLNFDEMQFSIDGMEHGHDALRGKGMFKIVMQKIDDAIKSGIPISVATVVHSENLDEFDNMEALFKEIGIKDWTVDVPTLAGNFKENSHFYVPPDIAGKYLNYGFGNNYHFSEEGFGCGLHLISVLANGGIAKCTFYADIPLGSINEGLKTVWERLKPVKLSELECFDISCPVINACRGGCRYRASVTSGTCNEKLKKDIYKCYAYGIIKREHEALE